MPFFLLSIICSLEGAFDYQIRRLDTAFERNFGPGWEFEGANLQKFKRPGDCPGRRC